MDQVLELQYALDSFYFLINGAIIFMVFAGIVMLEQGFCSERSNTNLLQRMMIVIAAGVLGYFVSGYEIQYGGAYFLDEIAGGDTLVADALAASHENGFNGDSIYSSASDVFFQVPFVILPIILVSSSMSYRVSVLPLFIFSFLFSAFIYPLFGAWTWNGDDVFGLFNLGDLGFSDFAGATIVCFTAGWAALTGSIIYGPRANAFSVEASNYSLMASNQGIVSAGLVLIIIGWFGINGGSVLKLGDIASANSVSVVYLNTLLSGVGSVLAMTVLSTMFVKNIDQRMTAAGILAGLISITGEPSTPTPLMAVIIGMVGAAFTLAISRVLRKLKIDDPIGGIAVFLGAGFWGTVCVPLTNDGVSYSAQFIGLGLNAAFIVIVSALLWLILKAMFGGYKIYGYDY